MTTYRGKGVFGGISIGRLLYYHRKQQQIKRCHVENPQTEKKRFEDAKKDAIAQLQDLYDKAVAEVGETSAMIFQIHQMMLEDLDYCESILNIIDTQGVNAEYAVGTTADNFSQMFSSMDDAYMKERAADVKDVSERLLRVLMGEKGSELDSEESVIIAANDLAPSETVQLDKNKILGFATMFGSTNSHTAILARTMNIPAVVGLGEVDLQSADGKVAIVDGFTGTVYIDPDASTLAEMEEKKKQADKETALLQEFKGKSNETLDGQKINIYANIGCLQDLGAVLKNDAGGIGLFRSEFLYLERDHYPTEEEQFQVYRQVAENMAGKRVIIRTLDIGADKRIDYFHLPEEENPAMGYRAIRICLKEPDIFKTQLRALLRASAFGKLAVMFPMIISLEEVRQIKKIIDEVKMQLKRDEIPYDEALELGIMIETPAAVMISDELAKEVDFFSIGTNDLTQYTLAIDRQNNHLGDFYDPHHKALLRMLKMVADNAHKNGIWMGICGELAADDALTKLFLAMNIDELSVSPGYILSLRKRVRETEIRPIREELLKQLD